MQRSSVRYSRASRHFHKFLHAYKHIKTFGSYLLLLVSRPPLSLCSTNQCAQKRLSRATATQESSRLNQEIFHLPDGPSQRARDDAMRAAMAAELSGKRIADGNPNQLADRTKNNIQFDYDAYAEVEGWWASGGLEQMESLGGVEMALKSRL